MSRLNIPICLNLLRVANFCTFIIKCAILKPHCLTTHTFQAWPRVCAFSVFAAMLLRSAIHGYELDMDFSVVLGGGCKVDGSTVSLGLLACLTHFNFEQMKLF